MGARRSPPQGRGRAVHDGATRIFSAAMIVIGVLLLARGAVLAVVIGVGMVGAGVARLWVVAQQRRRL
jgi:multisubunit Na+/H+ antiporter MnhC subunit